MMMKKLYILRHGQAPGTAESGVKTDFERPLSPEGRHDVRQAALSLSQEGGRPSLILHSPLVRAVQTAAVAAEVLRPERGVEEFQPLRNELPPAALAEELKRRCRDIDEVLAVGHQPQLGELVALLSGRLAELRPGGLAALDLSDGAPRLLWSKNPS